MLLRVRNGNVGAHQDAVAVGQGVDAAEAGLGLGACGGRWGEREKI